MQTFEFRAPNRDEYALLEAGIMRIIFIPVSQISHDELYDENDQPRRFHQVIVKSPSGKKQIVCSHKLTDIAKPGYEKNYLLGKKQYNILAVQHMYRVHVQLQTDEHDGDGQTPASPAPDAE